MNRASSLSRRGFSLIEIMIVGVIVTVLIGMLLPAIQSVREASRRVECEHNLQQIGTALHAFHDTNKRFPSDQSVVFDSNIENRIFQSYTPYGKDYSDYFQDGHTWFCWGSLPKQSTFYSDILSFMELHAAVVGSPSNRQFEAKAIKLFQCPSRRTSADGPKDDYGHGMHPDTFVTYYANWYKEQVDWQTHAGWDRKHVVMGGPFLPNAVSLQKVSKHDGSSTTAMLAHKGIEPKYYHAIPPRTTTNGTYSFFTGSDTVERIPVNYDLGWGDLTNAWEHSRYPGYFGRDRDGLIAGWANQPADAAPNSHLLLTSPHKVMPVLFVDGHVAGIGYDNSSDLVASLWAWDDGAVFDLE